MTVAICVLLAVLAAIEASRLGLAEHARLRRAPAIDGYIGQRVAVHRRGEPGAIIGILKHAAPDALIIVRAEHATQQTQVPLDGEQVVERSRLDFFQALGPGDA